MMLSRLLSVFLLLLMFTLTVAYVEEDEETEDEELTAKLWALVDKLDREAQMDESSSNTQVLHQPSFSERTKNGSLGYFSPDEQCQAEDGQMCSSDSSSSDDDDCVDIRPDCDKIARIGDCLYDDEAEDCALSCLLCRRPENKTFGIGRRQYVSQNFIQETLEDIEDMKEEWAGADLSVLNLEVPFANDDELLEAVAQQVFGTQKYMAEIVMEDPEYDNVRRSCQNYMGHCEIYAAMGYCNNNFLAGEDFLEMRQKCAPACRTCHDYALLQGCNPNADHNFVHEGDLDVMFRRMVGELDIDKKDLPYKASIHSRPGGDAKTNYVKDGKLLKSNGAVDGAWLITLEDFLTPEECDRMIELGAEEGYGRSGLQEGKDKRMHRTSVNAWCTDNLCAKDPIAQRVIQRISNTTGIPPAYSEQLQLLKYTEGQYYKMHHDVDVNVENHWPHGPRIMTFFLYLNEVEEGGATRMNDITHKDDISAPGDLVEECLEEADSAEDEASCALIELDIQPKRGMALVWPNLLDSNMKQKEPGTWHEARPVIKGEKYGANAWFRLRRFRRDCQSEAYEQWLESYNMTYSYEDDDDDDGEKSVLVMETLEDGATSNTKVESIKETQDDDDSDSKKTTTITTTTTTVSKTPTTITTTTTQVITTTTVIMVDESNKDLDDSNRETNSEDSDSDESDSDDEDGTDEDNWPSAL